MVIYIGDSHYEGGPTPPENAEIVSGEIVDDAYIQLGTEDTIGYIRSGGYPGFGDPPEDFTRYHKLTPSLGEGVTVEVDLSAVAAGSLFTLMVYSRVPSYSPSGAQLGPTAHQAWVNIGGDLGNIWQFNWAGWRWGEYGTGEDPYQFISPQGHVDGPFDPESMRWLSICFDGSDLASGGGYWALKVGGTQSALHIPTGTMLTLPPAAPNPIPVSRLARTYHPILMDDFVAQATVERGFAEMPYWDVHGQYVYMPLGYPWAVAGEDGKWHGTDNYVASGYVDDATGLVVYDWSITYPVRLG